MADDTVRATTEPLGPGLWRVEIIHVRVLEGGRFIGDSSRQLVLDPARASWQDWLNWRSIGEARREALLD